jgi:hypothetical protein
MLLLSGRLQKSARPRRRGGTQNQRRRRLPRRCSRRRPPPPLLPRCEPPPTPPRSTLRLPASALGVAAGAAGTALSLTVAAPPLGPAAPAPAPAPQAPAAAAAAAAAAAPAAPRSGFFTIERAGRLLEKRFGDPRALTSALQADDVVRLHGTVRGSLGIEQARVTLRGATVAADGDAALGAATLAPWPRGPRDGAPTLRVRAHGVRVQDLRIEGPPHVQGEPCAVEVAWRGSANDFCMHNCHIQGADNKLRTATGAHPCAAACMHACPGPGRSRSRHALTPRRAWCRGQRVTMWSRSATWACGSATAPPARR